MFFKIGILKKFCKTPVSKFLYKKVEGIRPTALLTGLAYDYIKKETQAQALSCLVSFWKFVRTPFFTEYHFQ